MADNIKDKIHKIKFYRLRPEEKLLYPLLDKVQLYDVPHMLNSVIYHIDGKILFEINHKKLYFGDSNIWDKIFKYMFHGQHIIAGIKTESFIIKSIIERIGIEYNIGFACRVRPDDMYDWYGIEKEIKKSLPLKNKIKKYLKKVFK